jgi:hypothetical protein
MFAKKLVLTENTDKKLLVCKRRKLHTFAITNICKPIFATFGRIGTWSRGRGRRLRGVRSGTAVRGL